MPSEKKEMITAKKLRLDKLLGMGSFGQTFKATVLDKKLSKKWGEVVAFKIPLPGEEARDSLIDDLVNMARIQGVLNCLPVSESENLVRFHGWDKSEDGYGIICEYVDGRDLQKWIDGRQSNRLFTFVETIEIVLRVCAALKVLHKAHIYHRDVKPSNIIVVKRDNGFSVKLTDFGLSTIVDRGNEYMSNSKAGAIAYQPPEIMANQKNAISPRYDLYSLGLVLYQMSTGALPYTRLDGPSILKESQDLDKPFRHPHEIALEVPERLAQVIVKAIDKDPEKRYQTAEEMEHDLLEAKQDLDRVISSQSASVSLPRVRKRIEKLREKCDQYKAGSLSDAQEKEIEQKIQQLVEEYPDQPEVYIFQGTFYQKWMWDTARSLAAYLQGLEQCPNDSQLLYCAGRALYTQQNATDKQKFDGVQFLKQALQNGLSNPMQVKTATNLVRAHRADDYED
ncbi:MAG TPA: serine/threonine-protein kinase [Candidatus Hydrogenedentes bacterium]|nr:serine/threonine-protein kinase [Candidatus Hydrogenedentota bacterium]